MYTELKQYALEGNLQSSMNGLVTLEWANVSEGLKNQLLSSHLTNEKQAGDLL
jgi:hypothetical protein